MEDDSSFPTWWLVRFGTDEQKKALLATIREERLVLLEALRIQLAKEKCVGDAEHNLE